MADLGGASEVLCIFFFDFLILDRGEGSYGVAER